MAPQTPVGGGVIMVQPPTQAMVTTNNVGVGGAATYQIVQAAPVLQITDSTKYPGAYTDTGAISGVTVMYVF
jgi:hypothetical protein